MRHSRKCVSGLRRPSRRHPRSLDETSFPNRANDKPKPIETLSGSGLSATAAPMIAKNVPDLARLHVLKQQFINVSFGLRESHDVPHPGIAVADMRALTLLSQTKSEVGVSAAIGCTIRTHAPRQDCLDSTFHQSVGERRRGVYCYIGCNGCTRSGERVLSGRPVSSRATS